MTEEHWQHVAIPFLEMNRDLGFGTKRSGREAYIYATALVAGYSFGLGEGRVQAMVPFWDMLNHAHPGEEGVRLDYDAETKLLSMITTRAHKKGEQVKCTRVSDRCPSQYSRGHCCIHLTTQSDEPDAASVLQEGYSFCSLC